MIVVCGEVILDVLRDSGGGHPGGGTAGEDAPGGPARFIGHPGGSPANTAVALARLGSDAGLCARISRSSIGALLREHLVANGVDLRYAIDADEQASLAFVDIGHGGKPVYSFYVEGTADWQWSLTELPGNLPADVSAFHTGSIAAYKAPGSLAIAGLLERERSRRLLSLDPNVRPALMGDAHEARTWTERLVALVDLVKASDEDIAWLYPDTGIDEVAGRWRALGAYVVIVTRGAQGALGYLGDGRIASPAREVQLVDTVGAGDAYAAAMLHWLEREHLTTDVSAGRLSTRALGAALDFAGAAAAIACSRAGADPPRAAEVDALLGADARPAPA